MIKKVVEKRSLEASSISTDLKYWLEHSPDERISAVEILRRQHYGSSGRLQRVVRIVNRSLSCIHDRWGIRIGFLWCTPFYRRY